MSLTFSAGQMGPFGAWLDSTVYEEGISYFLLRPPGDVFYISIFSAHPGNVYLIDFHAGIPSGCSCIIVLQLFPGPE